MKAAVITRFGSRWSIEVREVPKPVPMADDVLVRVRAATVNRTDCGELRHPLLNRLMTRVQSQRSVLGLDFAGEVEAVGSGVSTFKPGDRVFGMCTFARNGAQAEYCCVPETGAIGQLQAATPFHEAPVCEGAYYANGSVGKFARPGVKTLIYGASGAIGTAAVQLAKYYGADVTAVTAGRHLDMARSIGADRVLDYEMPEFRQLYETFDFVLDAVGKMKVGDWRRLLKPDGHFAVTDLGPGGQDVPFLLWSSITGNDRVSVPLPPRGSARQFVHFLKERMEAGEFRAIVDRRYALDMIADAYHYVYTGQKAGIVVIDV
jgi:NADPH:quinone reductase-like Zn-dependent oxidoreductase